MYPKSGDVLKVPCCTNDAILEWKRDLRNYVLFSGQGLPKVLFLHETFSPSLCLDRKASDSLGRLVSATPPDVVLFESEALDFRTRPGKLMAFLATATSLHEIIRRI